MMDSWVGDWRDGERWGDGQMDEWGGRKKGVIPGRVPSDPGMNHSRIAWNQEAPVLAALEDVTFSGLAWSRRLGVWGDCKPGSHKLTSKSTFSPSGILGAVSLKKREGPMSTGSGSPP